MTKPKLTPAQQRALDWLPKDGAWRSGAGRLGQALGSFELYHGKYLERQWIKTRFRYRLTLAGIVMFHGTETAEGT